MTAYDLVFGESPDSLRYLPTRYLPVPGEVATQAVRAGRIGSRGPGIDPLTWPRGPLSGLPMWHVLTIEVPEEYRRHGQDFCGFSFFVGEGQSAEPDDAVTAALNHSLTGARAEDPFLAQLATSRDHPQLQRRVDIIGGQFALIWLTREELAAEPVSAPADPRRRGEWVAEDGGANAWDDAYEDDLVWLVPRDDPNAGRAPSMETGFDAQGHRVDGGGYGPGGYLPVYAEVAERPDWEAWCDNHYDRVHLGGTAFPVQWLPDGFTPYFLEIGEEFGALNFGGDGTLQLDLESEAFDWACG